MSQPASEDESLPPQPVAKKWYPKLAGFANRRSRHQQAFFYPFLLYIRQVVNIYPPTGTTFGGLANGECINTVRLLDSKLLWQFGGGTVKGKMPTAYMSGPSAAEPSVPNSTDFRGMALSVLLGGGWECANKRDVFCKGNPIAGVDLVSSHQSDTVKNSVASRSHCADADPWDHACEFNALMGSKCDPEGLMSCTGHCLNLMKQGLYLLWFHFDLVVCIGLRHVLVSWCIMQNSLSKWNKKAKIHKA